MSQSYLHIIAWQRILQSLRRHKSTLVRRVIDAEYEYDAMHVSIGFCLVGITILIVDPSHARQLIVNGLREAFPFRRTRLPSQETGICY